MIINFTPNGMLPMPDTVPTVPVTAAEIVGQVHEAYEMGITMVHVHARKKDGTPSSEAKDYAPIIEGIRKHCPDLVVCASLSGRNVTDPYARAEVLSLQPDMGSLTLSSLNFPKTTSLNAPETIQFLAQSMLERGIKPELEVFDLGMMNYLRYLIMKGLVTPPFYINVILGNIAGAQLNVSHLAAILQELPENSHVSLGGIGRSQYDSHLIALAMGLGVRIGLEDNTWLDRERQTIASNRQLLQRLHELMKISGISLTSATSFGELGFKSKAQ